MTDQPLLRSSDDVEIDSPASSDAEPVFANSGINLRVTRYIRTMPDPRGKVVVDVPCGDGRASHEFMKRGAIVKPLDLYPEFLKAPGMCAEYADMSARLPLADESADYLICQEGIEHVQDQLGTLQEFNRVLKKGGALLITTPSCSHARSRLSWLLFESDYWKRMPANEFDSVWFSEKESDKIYFGHIFLLGVQRLQTLASIAGFSTIERCRTDVSNSSLILGALLYPFLCLGTVISWLRTRRKTHHLPKQVLDQACRERAKLNLSPKTMFCKHIFWILRKDFSQSESTRNLKQFAVDSQ